VLSFVRDTPDDATDGAPPILEMSSIAELLKSATEPGLVRIRARIEKVCFPTLKNGSVTPATVREVCFKVIRTRGWLPKGHQPDGPCSFPCAGRVMEAGGTTT
jgi:hypothetical protein